MSSYNFISFGTTDLSAPLVVLLHGRGANETSLTDLARKLNPEHRVISLRGPIQLAPSSYTWFQNRGIGRPIPESLRQSLDWFYGFYESANSEASPVAVIGFSGGAAFAGAIALDKKIPLAGSAILYGTVPFDAGLLTENNSLSGAQIFAAQGTRDEVMPPELMEKTWKYLHTESGATLEALKSNGGHEITPDVAAHLKTWIDRVVE